MLTLLPLAAGFHNVPLLTTIAAAFAAAWILGIITQRIGLSPIVGYLLAGVAIGPHTPGLIGDLAIATQLAEVGVILLMFGVGLHFHLKDLMAVKNIAVPGAIGQSLVATLLTILIFHFFGWSIRSGLVLGMAMSVASTVVLLRVLMDKDMLNSVHGHVAVGWLIVEDIFTVLALVLVPIMATDPVVAANTTDALAAAANEAAKLVNSGGEAAAAASDSPAAEETGTSSLITVAWALAKLAMLVVLVLFAGSRIVPWILMQVVKLRSRELFTLTVLVLSITIAVGSAYFFGASVALGAFLAGMVVAQSPVSHQAAADALPMRDAFAVLFFVSVGMLFDPSFLVNQPLMVVAGLGIVLIAKPLAALVIVATLGYTARTALTVAIGLAQIGEFSFILSQVGRENGLMSDDGHNLLVATAMISITINPLLFGSIDKIENWLKGHPRLWELLNRRANRRMGEINADAKQSIAASEKPHAVIVGYGPVGRVVDALLRDTGLDSVIIEMNMDTVQSLTKGGRKAIYGDGMHREVLEQAGIKHATHLIVTLPHSANRGLIVLLARELNPKIEVTVRARYLAEGEELRQAGANKTVFEEGEAGIAMARHVLEMRGMDKAAIENLLTALRRLWRMNEKD